MSGNRITILYTLALLAIPLWLLTSWHRTINRPEAAPPERAALGLLPTSPQPLPPHRLESLDRQGLPADELLRGRVLLVYLTTSCEPCVQEAEIISRLQASSPPNLRIYGISFERPAQVATFVRDLDLKFPVVIDAGSQLARALDIHYFPSKFLIEEGVITKVWRGATRDEADFHRQLGLR